MKYPICLIGLLLLFSSCIGNNRNNKDVENTFNISKDTAVFESEIKTPGVVIILPDSIEYLKKSILVRNEKGTVINNFFFDEKEQVVKFDKGTPIIREYYPDYSVIIFDGYSLENNRYKVFLNDSAVFLDNVKGYTIFEKWEEHIARAFIVTNKLNPLRETPTETGKMMPIDYDDSNFVVLEVENDWIKVECNIDCEGCPDKKLIKGWIRWKRDKHILVKLFYSC